MRILRLLWLVLATLLGGCASVVSPFNCGELSPATQGYQSLVVDAGMRWTTAVCRGDPNNLDCGEGESVSEKAMPEVALALRSAGFKFALEEAVAWDLDVLPVMRQGRDVRGGLCRSSLAPLAIPERRGQLLVRTRTKGTRPIDLVGKGAAAVLLWPIYFQVLLGAVTVRPLLPAEYTRELDSDQWRWGHLTIGATNAAGDIEWMRTVRLGHGGSLNRLQLENAIRDAIADRPTN